MAKTHTRGRKGPRPMQPSHHDVYDLLQAGYVTRLGLWMEANVWRRYSPTATFITNLADKLPGRLDRLGGFVVKYLGTGNYF